MCHFFVSSGILWRLPKQFHDQNTGNLQTNLMNNISSKYFLLFFYKLDLLQVCLLLHVHVFNRRKTPSNDKRNSSNHRLIYTSVNAFWSYNHMVTFLKIRYLENQTFCQNLFFQVVKSDAIIISCMQANL